jgi:F0F1-type ATP synthase assembly protein I
MKPASSAEPTGRELAGLGLVLAAAVLVPLLGGILLDSKLHSSPIGLFLGLLLGIGAASGVVYVRFVKRYT